MRLFPGSLSQRRFECVVDDSVSCVCEVNSENVSYFGFDYTNAIKRETKRNLWLRDQLKEQIKRGNQIKLNPGLSPRFQNEK